MGRRERKAVKNLRATRAAEAKLAAEDAKKAERARKREDAKAQWDAQSPEEKKATFKVLAVVIGVVIFIFVLIGACNGHSDDDKNSTSATTTSRTPYTPPPAPVVRPAPTNAEVQNAFQAYIAERAGAGVMLAQSVTSVAVADGVVTVTADPSPTLLELSPFDNLAELFGTPVAFDDDDGVWLREIVQRVDVVTSTGASLGSLTAAQLRKIGTGE
ncbi:hypothetical protein [Mycolicibacter heraklionensis]|uniref:hypothetical protein n=1 Tax=Mycolicibacter heraklionensis TaxID=512402 RepID=UPI000AE2DE8F|nr:hypothetical protein [Mycolicibacter heraklionensis]